MGREKKPGPAAAAAAAGPGVTAKERHKRAVRRENNNDWAAPLPQGLVALPEKHRVKSKHQSYFEIVENSDKKKKLEFQVASDLDVVSHHSRSVLTVHRLPTTKVRLPVSSSSRSAIQS